MLLSELFNGVGILNSSDFLNSLPKINILDISFNSKKVKPGDLFVCLLGENFDGHNFINEAIKNGAVCILASKKIDIVKDIPVILVKDTRKTLADISANFFKNPATELKLIGITGTKGKTSTSFMVSSILNKAGYSCGIIGTLGIIINGEVISTENTTPESYIIQKYLRLMVEKGIKYVVLEASSRGLKEHRLDNIQFECTVFTNFSLDHIGKSEHKNAEEYLQSKALLFNHCNCAFINLDDQKSTYIKENSNCKNIFYFSLNKESNFKATDVSLLNESKRFGIKFKTSGLFNLDVTLNVLGKFNVYNALAAILVAKHFNIKDEDITAGLSSLKIKGRMELLDLPKKFNFKIIIDYAHNALSMESLLCTLKEYEPNRLIVLFGAGGNRPKIRRYQLGKACGNFADFSIITADNSRFENTLDIIKDIKKGIKETNGKYIIIPNRYEAIKYAILNAKEDDILILAGKGHEDYDDVRGKKIPFNERLIVKEIIESLKV